MKLIISLLVAIIFVACSFDSYDLQKDAEKRYCKQNQYAEVLQYNKLCLDAAGEDVIGGKIYCFNRAITSICDSIILAK